MRKRIFALKPDILLSSTLCFHDCKFIPMQTFLNGACKTNFSWFLIHGVRSIIADNNGKKSLHEIILEKELIFIKCYS